MTQNIFLEWLKYFDRCMVNRKVLLIVDNCSAHVPIDKLPDRIILRNTTLFYLPPNTTSKIQPCDQGIIRNFKAYYRRRANSLLLQRLNDKVEQPEKIDVLQAIQMAVPAWATEVKPKTIYNCFRHCNIRSELAGTMPVHQDECMDNCVVEEVVSQIRQFRYPNPMNIRTLLDNPAEQEVAFVPDIDDVLENQLTTGETDDADDDSQEHPRIFPAEAHKMLQSLETFWMQQEADSQEFIRSLHRMKDKVSEIRVNQMVQKDIRQFFNSF
jgi:hypothetical protein